jgi:hypothetical protein
MELRDLLSDQEFRCRRTSSVRAERRFDALDQLAHVFAEAPEGILQKLVDIAVEFCGADSAGISLEEAGENGERRFRWVAIAGSFAKYLHGTTPRFFSPCGTCLDKGRAQLYRVTKPYYDFLHVEAEEIKDGILIPWFNDDMRGTIWAVSHRSRETFDIADYRLLNGLADFASIAIRHQHQQESLRRESTAMASAAKANEIAHQINNPLQSLTNALYLASQGGEMTQVYVKQASDELRSLSELVARLLIVSKGDCSSPRRVEADQAFPPK